MQPINRMRTRELRRLCVAQQRMLSDVADTLERTGTLSLYWIDHLRSVQNESPDDAGMRVSDRESGAVLDGDDPVRAAALSLIRRV